jgi:hypothetical protein
MGGTTESCADGHTNRQSTPGKYRFASQFPSPRNSAAIGLDFGPSSMSRPLEGLHWVVRDGASPLRTTRDVSLWREPYRRGMGACARQPMIAMKEHFRATGERNDRSVGRMT